MWHPNEWRIAFGFFWIMYWFFLNCRRTSSWCQILGGRRPGHFVNFKRFTVQSRSCGCRWMWPWFQSEFFPTKRTIGRFWKTGLFLFILFDLFLFILLMNDSIGLDWTQFDVVYKSIDSLWCYMNHFDAIWCNLIPFVLMIRFEPICTAKRMLERRRIQTSSSFVKNSLRSLFLTWKPISYSFCIYMAWTFIQNILEFARSWSDG